MGKNGRKIRDSSEDGIETLYGYCDFTSDGRPYYVGIGCLRRVKILRRNKKHTNVSKKHGQVRKILIEMTGQKNSIWKELCEWEGAQIKALETLHREGHIGCNFTIGGDGVRGFKRVKSDAERKKISESKKSLYANHFERRRLGDAIKLAKSDPVKHRNHCLGQQMRYANPVQRQKAQDVNHQKKKVQQLSLDGRVVCEFVSASEAIRKTGILNIKSVAQGKREFAGGYRWKYVDL